MRSDQWSRAKQLFEAALKRPPAERSAYLDGLSGIDHEVREEVVRRLQSDTAGSSQEHAGTGPTQLRPPEERFAVGHAATHVGPYRLVEEIGRGGMGTVHLAVRDDDEYRKRVAIKLLKKGMDSEDVVRRFRNERQILAAVEHSHIAKLYDGGTTDDGHPYFVMELVQGQPLDQYCDTHRLTLPERLELFRKVCSAVQVAHQNLVVHRDLKPGNILVTAEGEPKLLDFGIAKLLNPELASATVDPTRFQMGLMTPAYASPEQVRGETVTTATDVYSLGVILYELLTGHRPYQLTTRSLPELTRVVCEVEPTRPSQIIGRPEETTGADGSSSTLDPEAIGRARGASTDKLRKRLSGDLDNIVMMALRKEPQRRYASVEQLSEDIRRHLEGRPIRARKSTVAYRTSKFARRHRVGLAAAAVVAASLVGFTVVTVQARARAEREAAKAKTISEFMQKTLAAADPFQGVGREVTVVEALGKAVEELEGSFSSEPEVRAAIQKTIGATYFELGRFDQAEPLLVSALETRRELFGELHRDVADSLYYLAYLKLEQGDFGEAERLFREAVRINRELPGEKGQLADSLDGLAMALYDVGEFAPAEPPEREALELRRELDGEDSRDYSISANNLAIILEANGDFEEAETLYRTALAIDRRFHGNEHPEVATKMSNLGLLLLQTKGPEAGESLLREALDIRRKALGEHPATAASLSHLGRLLSHKGDAAEARRTYREALAMQRRLLGADHTALTTTLNNLARELQAAGELEEAESLLREAIAIWREKVGDVHPHLAVHIRNLASVMADQRNTAQAEARYREACSMLQKVHGADHWLSADCRSVQGSFLTGLARYEEAEALLLPSHEVLEETLGRENARTVEAVERLVALYEAWGKPDKAAEFRALLPESASGDS